MRKDAPVRNFVPKKMGKYFQGLCTFQNDDRKSELVVGQTSGYGRT